MVSIQSDYSEVLLNVGKFLFEQYLSSMIFNKPPDDTYKSTINFDYHFIIKIRRKVLQWYRNDFFSLCQETFSKLKTND